MTKITKAKKNEKGIFEFRMYNSNTRAYTTEPMTEEDYRIMLLYKEFLSPDEIKKIIKDAKDKGNSMFFGPFEDVNRKEW